MLQTIACTRNLSFAVHIPMAFLPRVALVLAALQITSLLAADPGGAESTCDEPVQSSSLMQTKSTEPHANHLQKPALLQNPSDDDCKFQRSGDFFKKPYSCQLTGVVIWTGSDDRAPYVTCWPDGDAGEGMCVEWRDDKCKKTLKDDWCCDNGNGGWKFLTDEIQQMAQVMQGDLCIGCHYQFGGKMDHDGNKYNDHKLSGLEGATKAFRCRDKHGDDNSEKFEKVAYIRGLKADKSGNEPSQVFPLAMLNVKDEE